MEQPQGVTYDYELVDNGDSRDLCIQKMFGSSTPTSSPSPKVPKVKASDDAPTLLFFAQIWYIEGVEPDTRVTNCCILGPAGSVSLGLNGCKSSDGASDVIQHLPDGFDVGYRPGCVLG